MNTISWLCLPWLALLGLSCSDLVAQNRAPRHMVIGQIDDEGGEWKTAKVFFFSQARLEGIEWEDAARGRQGSKRGVLARLQAGREYRVAARLDRKGQPSLWTRIEKIPPGGISFELRPRRFAPSRPRIRLHGHKHWKDLSPLEFRLLDALGRSRPLEESLDKDRRLPSLPGSLCWVEMRLKNGRRLHLFPIALKKKESPETLDLQLPPPIQIRMRVLDADTDQPIQEARIFDDLCRTEDIRTRGLRTDASGDVWFWMARPTNDEGELDQGRPILFRILAKGRQLACAGWNTKHLGADTRIPMPTENGGLDLEVHLTPCKKLKGQLLHFPAPVINKLRLFVRMQSMMPATEGLRAWTGLPWFEVRIQKDGSYELPRLSPGQGHLQTGIYFPDSLQSQWRKLQAEGKPLSRSERILPLPPVRIDKGTEDVRLPPINNKLLELLDLRVQLTDGKRGRDMPIRILFPDNETSTTELTRLLGLFDGTGRFRRLFYGAAPALYLQGPKGYALLEEEERRALRKKEPGKASIIQLRAMPTIRGKVFLVDGDPASMSRIRLRPYRLLPSRLLGGADSRYLKALTSFALNTEVQTGKDGSFEIPYLPFPERRLLLSATWRDSAGGFHHAQKALDFGHSQAVELIYSR